MGDRSLRVRLRRRLRVIDSVADLFRQIGHDERFHKEESVRALAEPRFR
jgi:hypothetical protein